MVGGGRWWYVEVSGIVKCGSGSEGVVVVVVVWVGGPSKRRSTMKKKMQYTSQRTQRNDLHIAEDIRSSKGKQGVQEGTWGVKALHESAHRQTIGRKPRV